MKSITVNRPRQKDADIRVRGYAGKTAPLSAADVPVPFNQPPPRRARIKQPPPEKLRKGVLESVFSPDGRRLIEDPTAYPYSAICSLEIINKNQELYYGTGFLAGPQLVLTAGHNVFYHGEGFMDRINVYPGLAGDRNSTHFPSAKTSVFATVEGWIQDEDPSVDIGAIFLPTDLGEHAGWLSVSNFTENTLKSLTVNISGYPRNPPDEELADDASTQWRHAAKLAVELTVLKYTADTSIGQSGSPVFAEIDDEFHAVGIHNTGFDAFNSATRINDAVFSQILDWRDESEA